MRTFIENYLHLMKNCIRPHYEKLKPLKSGFIENSNFENNRDPCNRILQIFEEAFKLCRRVCRRSEHSPSSVPRQTPPREERTVFKLNSVAMGKKKKKLPCHLCLVSPENPGHPVKVWEIIPSIFQFLGLYH